MNLEKIKKKLPVGWAEDADAMNESQLRDAIVDASLKTQEAKDARDADEKLAAARLVASEMAAPYRDAIKAQEAKVAYAKHLLEAMGAA